MKNKEIKLTELKCPKCSYKWETKSLLFNVTCPSCLRKVEVEQKKFDAAPPSVKV